MTPTWMGTSGIASDSRAIPSGAAIRLRYLIRGTPAFLMTSQAWTAEPPVAMRLDKQRFREMTEATFQDAIEAGMRIQRESYESGEPARMMAAFFAKRAAKAEAVKA